MIKFFETIENIVKEYSETDMDDWYYDGLVGYVRIRANPYESQIWRIISKLEYVDGITKIELRLAEDRDDDDDILDIDFIEIVNLGTDDDVDYCMNILDCVSDIDFEKARKAILDHVGYDDETGWFSKKDAGEDWDYTTLDKVLFKYIGRELYHEY